MWANYKGDVISCNLIFRMCHLADAAVICLCFLLMQYLFVNTSCFNFFATKILSPSFLKRKGGKYRNVNFYCEKLTRSRITFSLACKYSITGNYI